LRGDVGNLTNFELVTGIVRSDFPHLPTKSVVRYGAPALVAREKLAKS
jgi:hypothetical protein